MNCLFKLCIRLACLALPAACSQSAQQSADSSTRQSIQGMNLLSPDHIPYGKIVIDGVVDDSWRYAPSFPMQFSMDGTIPNQHDFFGSVQYLWQEEGVNILAHIYDDTISDQSPDPLENFWADDVLEIFFDPDASGGIHQYSHQAFAYHIALDGAVVDTGPNKKAMRFDHHIELARRVVETDNTGREYHLWELRVQPFSAELSAERLVAGTSVGLMVYYCDNDGTFKREHFMGTHPVSVKDGTANRGWIDADTFPKLMLQE